MTGNLVASLPERNVSPTGLPDDDCGTEALPTCMEAALSAC